jgi:hypothetical protein
MHNNRAANTDENKKYIEGRVQKIGGKRGLEGLSTEWEDSPDKTTGIYNLRVNVPEHDPVVIPFSAYDLRWLTYYPEPGEDVEAFSKNEKKFKAGSYNRKQKWDLQIRQALSGFGGGPIGFSS